MHPIIASPRSVGAGSRKPIDKTLLLDREGKFLPFSGVRLTLFGRIRATRKRRLADVTMEAGLLDDFRYQVHDFHLEMDCLPAV